MYKWNVIIIHFAILMLSATAISAEIVPEKLIKEYVAAVNGKDVAKLKRLIHPKCLACMNDKNSDFYEYYFAREFKDSIPDDYEIAEIGPISNDEHLMMSKAFPSPVRPTHRVQIDFETEPHRYRIIILAIVKHQNNWLIIMPCPTMELLNQFRKSKIYKGKQKARAMILAQKLKEPLLSELQGLLKKGNKIQAIKRFSTETGESLYMAKEVLSIMDKELAK